MPMITNMTPSDAHPARCDFPFDGYTHRTLPGRRPGAGEGLSSSRHHLPNVPRPITAGGSSALQLQDLHAFPGLRPATPGSAPPWSPSRGWAYAAADFASCCGPLGCSHHVAFDAGLRRRTFPSDAASLLPGSLTTTWTGLSPAGGDELADTHDHLIKPTVLRLIARILWTRNRPSSRW